MRNLYIILIAGIIIRIVLSLATVHPDIQVFNLAGKIVASGNIFNLYDYLGSLTPEDPIKNLAVLNYPPLIYWYHGIFNFVFSILGFSQLNQFLLDNPSNYGNFQFNIHLLLLKLPYLIFDLLTGFVIWKLFNTKRDSMIAFTLWIFNPINLYSTYMMGQFDIIPAFFIVLSIYMVIRNKLNLAALSLGFGIAFKLFPIFLLVPLLVSGRNFSERSKLFLISIMPYLLSIIPYIFSHNFRTTALFANQSSKSLYAALPVSGGETIMYFPAFLIFFYLFIWGKKVKVDIWKLYVVPLLLFFIFTHYHPQWFIWITPFLIIDLVKNSFKNILPILLILLSWLASLFLFDPSLTIGIFAPVVPVLYNIPSIWTILSINIDYNFSRSIIQTVFASASAYLIYQHFPIKRSD